jgi:DNA-binding LytR/AlgR family response regulator
MTTALIAEDEPLLAAALQTELARLWPGLRVLEVVGDGLGAARRALVLRPDLCFFDIRMPGQSGLEAAQTLAEDWPDGTHFPLIVFVTAYDQYALQAFDAHAVDYLVKPVETARLAACVARLQARLTDRAPQAEALARVVDQLRALMSPAPAAPRLDVVQAQVGSVVHMVPVDEVVYFEAADKYVRVVTAHKEYLIRVSLKDLLPQLDPQRFWQVHRGAVVQARCIETATRDDSGRLTLRLRGRPEALAVSRLHAPLFRGM